MNLKLIVPAPVATGPTMQAQGGAILLLAHLFATSAHLPAADFRLSTIFPGQLQISLHDDPAGFEIWRQSLGLDTPLEDRCGNDNWLTTTGSVADVPVKLVSFTSDDAVNAAVTA